MRPFTIDQLWTLARKFSAEQPPPSQQTAWNVLDEFCKSLTLLEPEPEPDVADALYLRGKEAYLKSRDPFRGLSKKARAIAEKARSAVAAETKMPPVTVGPKMWKDQLAVWIQSGELFNQRGVGEGTIKELCRLVTAPSDEEVKQ